MRRASFVPLTGAALIAALTVATPTAAQLIGLKTVPLAAGEQFLIFPSENLAMGGASIALFDPLSDPFSNPAAGSRVEDSRVFAVPTFYSVSNENGGARTMPVGVQIRSGAWFGGGTVAMQDLDMGRGLINWAPPIEPGIEIPVIPRGDALALRSSRNRYSQLSLGRELGDGWAVGVSAFFASLEGTDGVEQLFANAWDIEESGSVRDFRVGLTRALESGGEIEVALVRNRFEMTHDVTTVTWELTDTANWLFVPEVEEEGHLNISKTWGAHLAYSQPLEDTGWRAGGIVTVNRKDHPKIPTYDLTRVVLPERPPIPRDPGNSWAFNIGGGLAYEEGPTTFAIDMVFEPATSDTWADELVDVTAADGSIIPAGGHTVDNHFEFSNAHAAVGLGHDFTEQITGQLGVRMRSYHYRMEQEDHVLGLDRSLTQSWTEWTPTWGAHIELPSGLQLRYVGQASSAGHFPFPGFAFSSHEVLNPGTIADQGDVLAPPAGLIATPDETTVTHRIQISVPIR